MKSTTITSVLAALACASSVLADASPDAVTPTFVDYSTEAELIGDAGEAPPNLEYVSRPAQTPLTGPQYH